MDDKRVRLRLFDPDAQSAHCIDRVHAVFARQEAPQCAYSIRQSPDDNGPMGNTFIAGDGDFEIDSRSAFDP
jgi:hypothetical protein